MPTDLNILKKAFQNATATYEAAKPWDEPLDRRESVTTDQTFAAPVIPGDVGGWMASGGYPYQSTEKSSLAEYAQEGAVPPSQTYHETYPGREGYNDVDFVPYNWGTNRFGSKGGALLGHPISWEVVGPTSKSPFLHWQWAVNGTNNTLTLEAGLLTAASSYGVPTVTKAYNLSATGISDYNGGLYVLVTLTGDEVGGMLTAGSNGLTPTNTLTSRFELFRVMSYSGQVIKLESSKLLSSYFTIPVSPKVRSITLLRPKVTRLAGFPLSLNGTTQRNQVFAFLPPESAAVSEYMPPYNGGAPCPDWVTGNFDDAGAIPAGDLADYGTPNLLPIPAPVFQTYGYVTVAPGSAARWNLYLVLTGTNTIAVGQLVRVQTTTRSTLTDDGVAQTFGWFEAVTNLPVSGVVTLRRVPEVNSSTGAVFYGNGPVSAGIQDIVIVEVYDNLGTIFTDPVLSISKVVAARLDHLIDPSAESTSFRNYGSTNPARLGTPPGPAIFDTVTGSRNPGNLSDLGFRVVLFPAKDDGSGNIAPDFDNPITGNRVVLDPTLPATTEQYLEVDYSAGVLYLSHPPVPGAGCAVAPTGIILDAVNNPRNEVVLYAACVPYSREPSQRGGGVRVTVSRLGDGFGSHDSADIYGQRVVLEVSEPVGTNITDGGSFNIAGDATKFPARTGWFRFGEVAPVTGAFTSLSDPYYYPYGVISTPTNYIVRIVAMGGVTYHTTANTRVVFLKSPANNNNNPWDSDAVRGSSKRFDRINFRGGRTEVSVDGSLTLTAGSTTLDEAYRAGDPSTPGAGRVITVDGGAVEAQPDNTAGGDTFNASFRVDTTAVATNAAALVGFDFKGSGAVDPYAGFIDRRVFAPTTGDTVLADPFTCDVAVNVVTVTTGGNKFWTSLGVPRSLLMIPFDLIEIEGVTYLILSLDTAPPTGSSVVIVNLDGTAVNLTLSGVTAKVYRTRFYTSRGNTGFYPLNFNSWFAAQSWSETLNDEPIGALNLFAGSNTAISPGDGGGSTAALSFWSKFVTGGNTLEVRSPTYFDTFGRLNSSLTKQYFNASNISDYRYRGDFVTRAVKDTFSPTDPVIGHIVEDYTYDQYRYDYLSLLPLLSTVLPYTAFTTANTNTNGELVLSTALNFKLIPYGSAILEVISVDGDTTVRGLYLVYSGKSLPSTTLYIRGLDHSTFTITGGGGQLVVFRLYAYSAQGRNVNAPYWDSYGVLARTHTPTHTIAVGSEANAVGLAINSPDMKTGTGDRYAYRVSYGDAGTPTQPSNNEIAALDSYGYHKAQDYLYLESRTITKQINPHLFNSVDSTNNPSWNWSPPPFPCWQGGGNNHEINIPLDLPRSSARTDSAGTTLTHRTCLKSITVNGQFHGGGANYATVRVFMVQSSTSLPLANSTALLLNGSLLASFNLPNAGIDTSSTITVATNPGNTPVYIDDTTDYYYYAVVTSNPNNGNNDLLYSVQVTYTDPGPRNY